jgi:hypothetical protein
MLRIQCQIVLGSVAELPLRFPGDYGKECVDFVYVPYHTDCCLGDWKFTGRNWSPLKKAGW